MRNLPGGLAPRTRWRAIPLLALLLFGCSSGSSGDLSGREIKVTVTTGMIRDTVAKIGGERTQVTGLMGPGVDPHLYKASEGDIARLQEADIIFYNGLFLEGKMGDILVKIARGGKPVVAVSESVDPELLTEPPEFQGHYDPHIWFDVSMWAQTVPAIVEALSELDPSSRAMFEANGDAYRRELLALHEHCRERIASIERSRRVLVTAHDAFGYFGRAYEIEVIGLQGISTAAEYGLKDINRVVDILCERNIKAVFVESSVPRRSIEAVVEGCRARGHQVSIGGQLFSDAMGAEGTTEGTYVGMVRYNVETIVGSLR